MMLGFVAGSGFLRRARADKKLGCDLDVGRRGLQSRRKVVPTAISVAGFTITLPQSLGVVVPAIGMPWPASVAILATSVVAALLVLVRGNIILGLRNFFFAGWSAVNGRKRAAAGNTQFSRSVTTDADVSGGNVDWWAGEGETVGSFREVRPRETTGGLPDPTKETKISTNLEGAQNQAEEDGRTEYLLLSGKERAAALEKQMDAQLKLALEARNLSEDDLGPERLISTGGRDVIRRKDGQIAIGPEGEEKGDWSTLTINIPVPRRYLEVAERVNGQLAVFGLAACMLRQLLEPGHPLFTEQLLQTAQLAFLLPMILHTSLSNVQVDTNVPPNLPNL